VDATERLAHFEAEAFGNVVSGHPTSRSVAQGCGHVSGVRFGADHDDSVARVSVSFVPAATRKGCAVDDHEIGCEILHRFWEVVVEHARAPASVFAPEELEGHPLHRGVGDGYEYEWGVVAHGAAFAVHGLIISC